MKPVDQTLFGADQGNCFSACVASLLEVRIDALPNFCWHFTNDSEDSWVEHTRRWLVNHYCVDLLMLTSLPDGFPPQAFYLVGGMSKRVLLHSVIYLDGKLAHDPHPDRSGIEAVVDWSFLLPCPRGA